MNNKAGTYILCIETSTNVCSVALALDGILLYECNTDDFQSHTEKLTIYIEECCRVGEISLKDLSAIALSAGPGSYTGLRIGASTAKGLCFALDIPLIAVDSLNSLAYGIDTDTLDDNVLIVPAIDARRDEVYLSVMSKHYQVLHPSQPCVLSDSTITDLLLKGKELHLCGNGAGKFREHLNGIMHIHHTYAAARFMIRAVFDLYCQEVFEDIITFSPNYIKNPNITKKSKNLF